VPDYLSDTSRSEVDFLLTLFLQGEIVATEYESVPAVAFR
jgi:hypothetical protein